MGWVKHYAGLERCDADVGGDYGGSWGRVSLRDEAEREALSEYRYEVGVATGLPPSGWGGRPKRLPLRCGRAPLPNGGARDSYRACASFITPPRLCDWEHLRTDTLVPRRGMKLPPQ